jgi:hypothetical protein
MRSGVVTDPAVMLNLFQHPGSNRLADAELDPETSWHLFLCDMQVSVIPAKAGIHEHGP